MSRDGKMDAVITIEADLNVIIKEVRFIKNRWC